MCFTLAFIIVLCCYPVYADVSAQAYILYCPSTGEVVSQRNMNRRMTMASTTKIMTGLLLCEAGAPETIVSITSSMLKVEGTSIGLQKGDRISRINLAYGLLLESGNDAANAIAIHLAGSIEAFAEQMNSRAQQLGLDGTHFVTPSGLDADAHYTTAYDMAILTAAAMQNPTFRKIVGTKTYSSVYNDGNTRRTYSNHNRLLHTLDGADGVKTGFTKKSGRCLVSSCTRNGLQLIAVTLNAPNDWSDHKQLYNDGFQRYQSVTLDCKISVSALPVAGGTRNRVKIFYEPVQVWLQNGDASDVTYQIRLPRFIYAPVKTGEQVGSIDYIYNQKIIASVPFTTSEESAIMVIEQSWTDRFWQSVCQLLHF